MEHHPSPAFFVRGPSPFARLVFFAALSLALMATDARLHYLVETRQAFIALVHPLQVIANAPFKLYFAVQEYVISQKTLVEHNRRLVKQSLKQNITLQRFKTLEIENENMRQLLGAANATSQPAVLGEILHMGRDPFNHKIVVNVGNRQGIVSGQAVVDGAGVIGQVTRVYAFSSEVTLITDKELAIPIQIERNGLRAIAFGHGRDTTLDLPFLPANVDIRKGDKLVTSGIDGIYPAGLAVAEVTQIERNPDSPFAHIICRPIAGIERNRQLLLLGIPKVQEPVGKIINAPEDARQNTIQKNIPQNISPPPKPGVALPANASH
jgi:rod shape-determining protein MreC